MRILRSQYHELQHNASDHLLYLNDNEFGKNISNTGKNHVKDKEAPKTGKSPMVLRSRKGIDCLKPNSSINKTNIDGLKSNSSTNKTNIKISFEHVDESLKNINVVVEFIDMDARWLSKVYKTYENDLWRKKPRYHAMGQKKWYFYCGLCSNVYMEYYSIKCHLNQHLEFYPYTCKLCLKKYTGRKSATYHLQNTHNISRDQWNNFLTS